MSNKEYTVIHCHTELSNGVTNIDSVTKYTDYISEITNNSSLGIKGICFTEHGSMFEWYKKKCECEAKGLKYIHSVEVYVTESLIDKVRDNYHVCLYATDFESFKELNKLVSRSFNREDGHYYYAPRITFEELVNASNKILITSACVGGMLGKGIDIIGDKFVRFMSENKDRCFIEFQHHLAEDNIKYNQKLYDIHKQYNIPISIGTDTHALNKTHSKGRNILQRAKSIFFDDEGGWDVTLKSYDELIKLFLEQGVLPMEKIVEGLENTNLIYDRVQEFKIDKSYKYPNMGENPLESLKQKINKGIIERGVYT
ncbi:MAG: PHP domain-containing protein [Clostridium sp.]